MTSYLKTTKTDVKEARKILKQSREIYSKREQLKAIKEKIWKKSEMKKVNPLPMQSTRRETAEANKRVPKTIHPRLASQKESVELDIKFRQNPTQKEWTEIHKRIYELNRIGLEKERISEMVIQEFTGKLTGPLRYLKERVVLKEILNYDKKIESTPYWSPKE